ncbi:hypothetical protein Fmac_002019 [Flemingia macrophylla]|uniref:RNase H type-1 domain-containing protein n=1 Tax=Flemingia macrophylla TaxID=520843 RepID=A0ABD1NIR7_9FABA
MSYLQYREKALPQPKHNILIKWLHARKIAPAQVRPASSLIRWIMLPQGLFTCNVDATIFQDAQCFGYGICIHNPDGIFISTCTRWQTGTPQVHEAEAIAVTKSIQWLVQSQISDWHIKTDCQRVVNDLQSALFEGHIHGHE